MILHCDIVVLYSLVLSLDVISYHIIESEPIVIVGVVEPAGARTTSSRLSLSSVGSQRSSGVPSSAASLSHGRSSMEYRFLDRAYRECVPLDMYALLLTAELVVVALGIPQDPGLSFNYSPTFYHIYTLPGEIILEFKANSGPCSKQKCFISVVFKAFLSL